MVAFLVGACGSEGDKPKVALDSGDGKSAFDESLSAAGAGIFTDLRTLDSPHPYRNAYVRRWEVVGSEDAIEMKISFVRFETETGYDLITVTDGAGGQRTEHSGTKTGNDVVVQGNRVIISINTDSSVTAWGVRMNVSERLPCTCAESYEPVCGTDGNTYANECYATCDAMAVDHRGECNNLWTGADRRIESAHPYTNSFSSEWVISEAGARQIRAHFSRIETERGYDFVTISDKDDRVIATYSGKQEDITTPVIAGDTLKIRFTTDSSVTGWGFLLDRYEIEGGCNADSDCGPGMGCAMVQCIRAPCLNVCYPLNDGYTAVTTEELNSNPQAFTGLKVSVTSEPTAGPTACTRIGCSAANPCCNQCNTHFYLEGEIALEGNGVDFGCGGNECNWAETCTPFRANNNGPYELRGVFSVDQYGTKRLVVDTFTAAACGRQGCGGQVCGNAQIITNCAVLPEHACYAEADCRAQGDGHCGFSDTETLNQCLASYVSTSVTLVSSDTPVRIPDNDPRGISAFIGVPRANNVTSEVRVSASITHTYRGDLQVVLLASNGSEIVLHNRTGGSYDNLVISDVSVGTYEGGVVGGAWTLVVRDGEAQDVGTLDSFSITLTPPR
jgi:hypothetical protein